MNEQIKREDAIKATWHEPSYIDPYNILTEVRDRIEALPTIDAVPVVRCKDCKYWEEESTFCLNKEGCYGSETTADWFCADGKEKEE